jgi:hypothetical protein
MVEYSTRRGRIVLVDAKLTAKQNTPFQAKIGIISNEQLESSSHGLAGTLSTVTAHSVEQYQELIGRLGLKS